MSGFRALILTVTLVTPFTASAEINAVSKVTAHADGGKTIVVVHGSATPSFTAYRLERPPRIVVDLADGRVLNADGPMDVDTWAVGQIALAQYSDDTSRTARVMIGFKRPSSYDVRAKGHDVIITITPDERPPADQLAKEAEKARAAKEERQKTEAQVQVARDEQKKVQAQLAEGEARRNQVEAQLKNAEAERAQAQRAAADLQAETQKMIAARAEADRALKMAEAGQKQAEKARLDEESRLKAVREARAEEERRSRKQAEGLKAEEAANAQAEAARREAEVARARAQAAQAELSRVIEQKKTEQARLDELAKQADQTSLAQKKEQARLAELKAEAGLLAQKRAVEAKQLAEIKAEESRRLVEAQADERRQAEQRTQRAEESQALATRRAEASESARVAEERRARAQAEEAARLRAAAEAQKKLDAAEEAIAEAERRAKRAAQSAEAEQQRLESMRVESRKLTEAADKAREQVERQRAESARLFAVQETERARVERARMEARGVADQRAQEAERAAHAAAMASASKTKMEAAERDARRIAELAERQSARLEAARVEAQSVARDRQSELKQLEVARAEAQKLTAQREAELKQLSETRMREQAQIAAARRDLTRLSLDVKALEHEKLATQAALQEGSRNRGQLEAERAALEQRVARARSTLADLETSAQGERSRLEGEKSKLQGEKSSLEGERAQLERKVASAREDLKKLEDARRAAPVGPSENDKRAVAALEQRVAHARALLAELDAAAQGEKSRLEVEKSSLESERAQLERKVAKAREDLQKLEADARQAGPKESDKQAAAELEQRTARARAQLAQLEAAAQGERSRLEGEKSSLEGERAQLERKVAKAREDLRKLEADARQAGPKESDKRAAAELEQRTARARAQLAQLEAAAQGETRKLEGEKSRLEGEKSRLEGEKSSLEGERAQLEQRVARAREELKKLESDARARLAVVPTPAKMAAVAAKVTSPAVSSVVRDVRFADSDDAERIIVEVPGEPECSVLRSDARTAVLRIAGAVLPKKLERTLDAAAYQGPIKTISTYKDPEDAGAVRVVVALADGNVPEPKLVRDHGRLSWEFPRGGPPATAKVESHSYSPERVGGFGASIPLQVAQATQSVPMPGLGGGRHRHVYSGRRIDLDFKDADIHNILRLLSDVGQVNFVVSDDVKGTISVRMRDVPWDQALDVILRTKGLGQQREGNLIRVAPSSVLEKELEAEVARAKAAVELKPIETRLVPLSYADGTQIMQRVQEIMSPRGKVSVDTRTNMLIITDVSANIALAEDLVRNLDTQTPQVSIEARIVEASSTFLRDIGIQWGGGGIASAGTGNPTGIVFPSTVGLAGGAVDSLTNSNGLLNGQAASPNYVVNMPAAVGTGSGGALGLTLGSVSGNVNINLRLSALENTGNVRIVSAPKITTVDNIEATIEQGTSIPISVVSAAGTNTVFVDAKLNLTVKPHVTNEGSVIMNIAITRNEPDFVNTSANGTPTILKKQAKTEMLVRDGDTAVIGGIFTRNTGLSYSKVPWFADIPILGWLFKNRRENDDRTELLIFITPRIVNRASSAHR